MGPEDSLPLQKRRENLCVDLIKKMSPYSHKLHTPLPKRCLEVREREIRTNPERFYFYPCRTERFKRSPLVCMQLHGKK